MCSAVVEQDDGTFAIDKDYVPNVRLSGRKYAEAIFENRLCRRLVRQKPHLFLI